MGPILHLLLNTRIISAVTMDIEIPLLVACIAISGIFSGAEIAFFSLSDARRRTLIQQQRKNAVLLERIMQHPQRLLITILIANNLVNIGASSLATLLAIQQFGSAGVGIATGIMTFLILLFGEITPKTLAHKSAEKIALRTAPLMQVAIWLFLPLSSIMHALTQSMQRANPLKDEEVMAVSEEEVKALVDIGHEEGVLEQDEREMINRVLLLNDKLAEDVMTTAEDMIWFRADDTIGHVLPIINESGFSRFPVLNIAGKKALGILYIKDIFALLSDPEKGKEDILAMEVRSVMKDPLLAGATTKVDDLIPMIQVERKHLAIVVNARNVVRGIVTLEDMLEEVVGEIIDETDDESEI